MAEINLTPPQSAKNNAKRALAWKKKYPDETSDSGTAVGWARANQLAKGGELSPDTVRRMAQFNRHRKNSAVNPKYKDEPWKDNGYLMWLAWGGTSGVDWAIRKAEEMGRKKSNDASQEKIEKVMREFEEGKLRSSTGEVVTSKRQALAIAMSYD